MTDPDPSLRRTIRLVALLNLGYFGVEFVVATSIGSVSLFADSIDFLEDTVINALILLALGWSLHRRSRVGMALAIFLVNLDAAREVFAAARRERMLAIDGDRQGAPADARGAARP